MNKKKGLRRFFTLDVHNHEGFTLVELIIVIAILAILAGVAVVGYSAYVEKANKSADDALIYEVNQAFRAACIENFCDVYDITAAYATIANGKVAVSGVKVNGVTNGEIAADFATYFNVSNVELKHYKSIKFEPEQFQFAGSMEEATTFTDDVMAGIWNAFDTIGSALVMYGTGSADTIRDGIMNHLSSDLANALGVSDMVEGYITATNLSNDELDAYLRDKIDGYDDLSETDKESYRKQYKANLGIFYFADAANTNDPKLLDKVMASLDVIVAATRNTNVTITQDDIWTYYTTTARGQKKLTEEGEDAARADCQLFLTQHDYMLGLNGMQLVATNKAIQQAIADSQSGQNAAGVNTLGALYALSAGYFNNTAYWNDEIPDVGAFPNVIAAMMQSNFKDYYDAYGRADVAAYLEQMGLLADKKGTLDLSQGDVFSSMNNPG